MNQNLSIYQIYPRSFFDSNGDGIGDLKGIIKKLEYIAVLGFDAIWISPFFKSPQQDFGYDVSDYTSIAPEYGTMTDAVDLIDAAHNVGLKVILDMVMNHTSIEHDWFCESASSRTNAKADWYIWADKPNNWKSLTGGSGWHFSASRKQWYYASFLPFQPDLNYRNPEVKNAMFDVVKFWLEKGVDGFRLDIFNVIYKDAALRNNPFRFRLLPTEEDMSGFFQDFKYTVNLPESFHLAKELRALVNTYGEKILLGEVFGSNEVIRNYLGNGHDALTHVFNFKMLNIQFKAEWFYKVLSDSEAKFPYPYIPVYVFSNHDKPRSMSRLKSDEEARLLHFFQLTVRGMAVIYYGEEIGMKGHRRNYKTALDPIARKYAFVPRILFDLVGQNINRDEFRTPMQWNSLTNAGFSTSQKTWLPVSEDYQERNVLGMLADDASLTNIIKQLLQLRKVIPQLSLGALQLLHVDKSLLAYERRDEKGGVKIVLNFSDAAKRFKTSNVEVVYGVGSQHSDSGFFVLGGKSAVILHAKHLDFSA